MDTQSKAGSFIQHTQPSLLTRIYRSLVPGMPFNDAGIFGFDVSFWQDRNDTAQGIDFAMMKNYGASFVIIRAGQNLWPDPDFAYNWREAKAAGLPRASYWFYDPRVDPKAQAALWCSLVKDDAPEGRMWLDMEFPASWGGSYTNWIHWKTMLEEIKQLSGLPCGIYSAQWWWQSHEAGVDNNYFGAYPLWVAQYTSSPAYVTLPLPWRNKSALIWQDGTPAVGLAAGAESLEIDHNKFNGDQFELEFGGAINPPPTGGSPMKGKMLGYTVNVRNAESAVVAALKIGDVVYGEVTGTRPRINFSKIYRADGTVQNLGALHNAVTTDGGSVVYMTLTNESEPIDPPPADKVLTNTIHVYADGSVDVTPA